MARRHNGGNSHKSSNEHVYLVGVILLVFGLLLLAEYVLPNFNIRGLWPFVLIAIGLGLLWNHAKA